MVITSEVPIDKRIVCDCRLLKSAIEANAEIFLLPPCYSMTAICIDDDGVRKDLALSQILFLLSHCQHQYIN
jgi:hypothetical protein